MDLEVTSSEPDSLKPEVECGMRKMIKKSKAITSGLCAALLLSSMSAAIAEPKAAKQPQATRPAAVQTQAPVSAIPLPDTSKLTLLIQMTVAALALSNLTGDYATLSKLGTPAFQAENPPAKLMASFNEFRTKSIDISPALIFQPILVSEPKVEGDVVRLVGFYNTQPQRIAFDLAFQASNNLWRLAAIDVRTVVPKIASNTAPPKPANQRGGETVIQKR